MSYAVITGRTTNSDGSTSWDAIAGTQGGTYNLREQGATTVLDSTRVSSGTTTPTKLAAPAGLAAAQTSSTSLTATYNNVANNSGYTVQYATNADFTRNAGTVSAAKDATSAVLTGLLVDTLYYLRAVAVGTGSYATSDPSTAITQRTAAAPVPVDSDYQAYADASQEQSPTVLAAVKKWIKYLKDNGLWADMAVGYMVAGTTQLAHSLNVRNVNAYQATYPNGATFTAGGTDFTQGAQQYGYTNFPFSALQVDNLSLAFNTSTDSHQLAAELGGTYTDAMGNTGTFDLLGCLDDTDVDFEMPLGIRKKLPLVNGKGTKKGLSLQTVLPPSSGSYMGGPGGTATVTVDKNGVQLGDPAMGGAARPADFVEGVLLLGCRAPGVLHSDALSAGAYAWRVGLTQAKRTAFAQGLQQFNADLGRPSY